MGGMTAVNFTYPSNDAGWDGDTLITSTRSASKLLWQGRLVECVVIQIGGYRYHTRLSLLTDLYPLEDCPPIYLRYQALAPSLSRSLTCCSMDIYRNASVPRMSSFLTFGGLTNTYSPSILRVSPSYSGKAFFFFFFFFQARPLVFILYIIL